MEIQVQDPSPTSHVSARRIIGRGLLFGVSTAVGLTVTYPVTLRNGTPALRIFSNAAFMVTYGSINTWACYESGERAIAIVNELRDHPSIGRALLRTAQTASSIFLGAISEIPLAAIAWEMHGIHWALIVELGGLWLPATSQDLMTEAILNFLFRSPKLARTFERKMRLTLAHRLRREMSHLLSRARLMTKDEKAHNFSKWAVEKHKARQLDRVYNLFDDLTDIDKKFYKPLKPRNRVIKVLRVGTQLTCFTITLLYFIQVFILGKSISQEEEPNAPLDDTVGALGVISLFYLVMRGAIQGSGDVFDLASDLLGFKREKQLEEHAFPKFSKALYLLAFGIAFTPQWISIKIAGKQHSPDDLIGYSFAVGYVNASIFFVFHVMRDLLNKGMRAAMDLPWMSEEIKTMKRLEADLKRAQEELFEFPLGKLLEIVDGFQDEEVKNKILEYLDLAKIRSHEKQSLLEIEHV